MSAPFIVSYAYGDGHKTFATLDEALNFARTRSDVHSITGDDYDCDCDQDGYFVCNDGLTDEERERVEEFFG